MILYSMLLSSNRLTPEEGLLLTPFFKSPEKQRPKETSVMLLPEVEDGHEKNNVQIILKFQVSKKTAISYKIF